MNLACAGTLAVMVAALPVPAAGQTGVGVLGYGSFGIATLAAGDTFDAVAGTTSAPVFGGGAQLTGLWRGLFADVALFQLSLDGERVFVDDEGTVFELGIPLEVRMRPVDIAAGWRFAVGRVSPFAGAGVTFMSYEETSDFAAAGDDVSEGAAGMLLLGGVDVRVWRWFQAGGELRYRRVPGILGEGGVSAAFGDDDAGGFSAAVRISVGR